MPRTRKRTTNFRSYSDEQLKNAVSEIIKTGMSARIVAKQTGIPRCTLNRYIKKAKLSGEEEINYRPKNEHLKVFSHQNELLIVDYIRHASSIHYGMTSLAARKLAFEFGEVNNIPMPANWKRDGAAGKEWLYSMMKRHKFSFRTPEQTSIAHATSFNEANVKMFYNNFKDLKATYKFLPQDVYNLDETGCGTVHKPQKVIADCGKRVVGQITSAERGSLVTCVNIICATGKAIPPFIIFPMSILKTI